MVWGKRQQLFIRLREAGLRPLIQTAFVERVNLTFRQSVACLSRRTWAYTQTERHLLLHCEWFRLYYHLVRAHEALALQVPGLKRRFRPRSLAMALPLTDHLWSVRDLLSVTVYVWLSAVFGLLTLTPSLCPYYKLWDESWLRVDLAFFYPVDGV